MADLYKNLRDSIPRTWSGYSGDVSPPAARTARPGRVIFWLVVIVIIGVVIYYATKKPKYESFGEVGCATATTCTG